MKNIFQDIPAKLPNEVFQTILRKQNITIERIVSKGHTTPPSHWYDQESDEWVIILQGAAKIRFINQPEQLLKTGDYLWIPAHQKHQVTWTSQEPTIWLAIHILPDQ